MKINFYTVLIALATGLFILRTYTIYAYAPPVPEYTLILGDPDLYRIYYTHISVLWASFVGFGVTFVCSIIYLMKREHKWDAIAVSSATIGVIFCALGALIFGPIFAYLVWGRPWHWDPKQTMALILWVLYVGYVTLHASIVEPEVRARISAVFGICAFPSVPLSYLIGKILPSMHPPSIIIDPRISITVIVSFLSMVVAFSILVKLMYDALTSEEKISVIMRER